MSRSTAVDGFCPLASHRSGQNKTSASVVYWFNRNDAHAARIGAQQLMLAQPEQASERPHSSTTKGACTKQANWCLVQGSP